MKRILIAAMLLASVAMVAQPARRSQNSACRMDSMKIAFITEKLDLSEAEAEKFWPVYNNVEKQQKEAVKAEKQAYMALNKAMAEEGADLKPLLDAYLKAKQANVDFHAKAVNEYRKVLPEKKVAMFFTMAESFRRQMIGCLGKGKPGAQSQRGAAYGRPGAQSQRGGAYGRSGARPQQGKTKDRPGSQPEENK